MKKKTQQIRLNRLEVLRWATVKKMYCDGKWLKEIKRNFNSINNCDVFLIKIILFYFLFFKKNCHVNILRY